MILGACALSGHSGHEAGLRLLEQLYRIQTGKALPPIVRTDRGKPSFADSTWHFSITHTDRHAFCALAACPVGIDAEELDRWVSPRLAEKVLSPQEMRQMEAAPDSRRAFLTFWVLKEASLKCSGQGLRYYPNDTNFSLTDPRVREWEDCLVAVVTAGGDEGETYYAF